MDASLAIEFVEKSVDAVLDLGAVQLLLRLRLQLVAELLQERQDALKTFQVKNPSSTTLALLT
jgi:hypothetical protein